MRVIPSRVVGGAIAETVHVFRLCTLMAPRGGLSLSGDPQRGGTCNDAVPALGYLLGTLSAA